MILSYDQRPDATVDQKVQSLMESVQMAFNAIDGANITGTIDGGNVKIVKVDGSSIVGTIDGNYVFVKNLDARSITSEAGWVDKLMVQTGLLAHEGTVFTLDAIQVNAANITAGTIDVERLVVTDAATGQKHMVTWNETTQQWDSAYLNGGVIEPLTITADKIVAGAITAEKITTDNIVGTGGWINLRNGTFSYTNAQTQKGITWDGSALNIKADSILFGANDEDLSASLSLKANKATLTSEINLTADQVKIISDKLDITGVITAINDDSTTTIDGGKIATNSIEANALKIGGVITAINNDTTTTISGGKIETGSITSTQIATGAITADKINLNQDLTIGSLSGGHIALDADSIDFYSGNNALVCQMLLADGSQMINRRDGNYQNRLRFANNNLSLENSYMYGSSEQWWATIRESVTTNGSSIAILTGNSAQGYGGAGITVSRSTSGLSTNISGALTAGSLSTGNISATGAISAGNIACGRAGDYTVSANGTTTATVSFGKTFSIAPNVVATIYSPDSGFKGNVITREVTKTNFKLYIANLGTSPHDVFVDWIAIY